MTACYLASSETQGQSVGSRENFQLRAKEPLGIASHWTISKNSNGCQLLSGHKKPLYYCVQSANRISWVLFVCLYTTPTVSPYLSGSFTKVVHAYLQGKLSLPAFLNRNEGWLFPFNQEKSASDRSRGIINNANRRRDRQKPELNTSWKLKL